MTDDAVVALAGRIVDVICKPFTIEGQIVGVGASVGVAVFKGAVDPEQVIRDADKALYEAKTGGRGQYRVREANSRAA